MSASVERLDGNSPNRLPPLVKSWPLVGSAYRMIHDPLTFLKEARQSYGDIFRVKVAGMTFVVLAGVEANRFMALNGDTYLTSRGFWEGTLKEMDCPHSFIGVDGDVHRFQRRLMKPMFSRAAFNDRIPRLTEIFKHTIEARFGTSQRVSSLIRLILSHQIGSSLQGYQPTPEEVEALMRYQTTAMNVCSLRKWPRAALWMPRYRKAKKLVHELADRIVAAENTNPQSTGYFHTLKEHGQKTHPEWFTPGDLRNHAIIPYLAGIDTVGATLSFMLLELFKQPAMYQALQRETDARFRDGLEKMETLQNFIREVMRLYPTVFALRRTAAEDFSFQGYMVRRGEELIIFTTASHTDPRWFEDPERFDISRYQAPRLEHQVGDAWTPFGRGAHTCIGAGLANTLLALDLALFLRYTDLRPSCDIRSIKMNFSNPAAGLDENFKIFLSPRTVV
jgi:cytochrome P450